MFRSIITTFALVLTVACAGNGKINNPESTNTVTNTVTETVIETVQVAEAAETRNQFEILYTQCGENNTIELAYDDVVIVTATHNTTTRRQPVEGWSKDEATGLVSIAYCEEDVQVVYLYR